MPEILDELPANDPRAVRSRRDLIWINRLMGNERWILKQMGEEAGFERIIEIGAGSGHLLSQAAKALSNVEIAAVDLAPRPSSLDPRVKWYQGDLFDHTDLFEGSLVIANLFLHHFKPAQLRPLGQALESACGLIACEPERRNLHKIQGNFLRPFLGDVTRHDMQVSIDAGFRDFELPEELGLRQVWQWCQTRTWTGSHRLKGVPK